MRVVELHHFVETLNDNRLTLRLSHQSQHLSMSLFTKDDNLRIGVGIKLFLDAFLQLQHHRTGGIDNLDIVTTRQFVSLRRLAMST